MRTLRAALLWAGIGLATLLFGLPAVVAAFVPPRGDWFLRFARGWARTILFMRAAVSASSNDSCAITWHQWQAE